ncbi:hypothetical protein CNO13_05440 (plasmid) [Borrelia miyamotoi]|uniref:Uncharacterized protein n=3 Tax=Borrelia miyamotoi TaxID=47466 RepID=A0ABN5DUE9_9SPIR|nr:hypothetical protein [Borrelia miyamotoi]AHH05859.1 BDR-repeat family protein [Borrelia miyamotoi FR64b]ATQ16597.1 hypothetical protein CNO13_05440 [Borrelia miyamotoi]ATQ17770.1 hypothetical protein CNO12_05605 [Borrelia miyamotoi]ATQ18990.2 hypothetical protein CNO11_05445 [Borrelia miyamotoi]ATQ20285.2 hypothetical protein CNO10_05680 [Borrelia miyamotoi]
MGFKRDMSNLDNKIDNKEKFAYISENDNDFLREKLRNNIEILSEKLKIWRLTLTCIVMTMPIITYII